MDCLVTGGAGFIGSNLVDALIARGDRVAVIDNLSTGRRENLSGALERGVKLDLVDLRDPAAVAAAVEPARPEVIFHLGAQIDVRHSVREPTDDAMTNVVGTVAVLEAARNAGVRRVVNSSSGGAAYGETDAVPTSEDHPVRPMSPYGQSKYLAESYCELYARIHGLSTISLRYSNVYGPRQDPHGEGGVVAIFCGCLVDGRRPTVFGDGRQTRDWIEVSDVVSANLLAADSELPGAVNIGRGEETSVLDLIATLNEVSDNGQLAEPEFAPERQGEVRRSCLDVGRARRQLGWEAGVSLPEGLQTLLDAL
jgi:UDP-glucose 4-epimerase